MPLTLDFQCFSDQYLVVDVFNRLVTGGSMSMGVVCARAVLYGSYSHDL